jgi:hypothetical protein
MNPTGMDIPDQLQKLKSMLRKGDLSQEEYDRAKHLVLNPGAFSLRVGGPAAEAVAAVHRHFQWGRKVLIWGMVAVVIYLVIYYFYAFPKILPQGAQANGGTAVED